MSTLNKLLRTIPVSITLAENKEIPKKLEVIRCGKFDAGDQGIVNITPEMLKSFKKNFDDNVRKIDLSIDYAHESQSIAAAWFTSVELADDEKSLLIEVDWTPKGKDTVLSKEFRYLSADFNFNYTDNETKTNYGPTLLGAGLTNRPVIKGMQPVVQLSEENTMDPKDQEIANLKAEVEKLKAGSGGGDHAAAMAAMKKELDEEKSKTAAYAEKEKAAAATAAMAEKKADFDKMLSEGKCCEAQRDAWMKGDMKDFAAKFVPVKLAEQGHGGKGEDIKLTEEQKTSVGAQKEVLEKATKLSTEKKIDLGTAISTVLSENPKLAEAYRSAYQ